jgi:uncharacterized protein
MLHPHTELRFVSPEIGYGIFVTQKIPMGTITWAKDALDRIFTFEEMSQLPPHDHENLLKYTYRNKEGNYYFCWDLTRFVNHNSEANSMLTPYGFEIALRDIEEGEELTNDYGTLNIVESFQCSYLTNKSREIVHPNDLLTYSELWDKQIFEALQHVRHIAQPLTAWISPETQQEVDLILKGEVKILSVKTLYFEK